MKMNKMMQLLVIQLAKIERICTSCQPVLTGKTFADNIFAATPGVIRCISFNTSPIRGWKKDLFLSQYLTSIHCTLWCPRLFLQFRRPKNFIAVQNIEGLW